MGFSCSSFATTFITRGNQLDADELGGLGVLRGDMGEIDLASLLSGSLVQSEGGLIIAESPFGLGAARPRTTAAAAQTAADSGSGVVRDEHGGDPASVLELLLELKVKRRRRVPRLCLGRCGGVDSALRALGF